MRTPMARVLSLTALLLAAAAPAAAHDACASIPADLPPGTCHDVRITSMTSLSVAQEFTQRIICSQPNACLHNEVHLLAIIDFDAGTIVIDGRAPTDENGNSVPPGGPGGILAQTLSGPTEMRFAPPCENPDGCVGGEAVYFGTIDQGGNIRFPSLGFDFELFGVSPISRFRASMGTGPSTDPADPAVVAEGIPLDFSTGALQLAGVDFIPAPVVGTILQVNRVNGSIFPVPIPPADRDDLVRCQDAIETASARYVRRSQPLLQGCVDELLACEVAAETGAPVPGCTTAAAEKCNQIAGRIIKAEQALSRRVVRSCRDVGPANIISLVGGLGLSMTKPQCDDLGIGTSTREDIAFCLEQSLACSVEQLVGRIAPRAAEVLTTAGVGFFTAPEGCIPALGAGDASGEDAKQLLSCQGAIEKQAAKAAAVQQKELQACMSANLVCHLEFEDTGTLDPDCVTAAAERCATAERKIAVAETKRLKGIQRGCADVDAADIPAIATGLGFAALADLCAELDPPVALDSVDDLVACLDHSLDCSVQGIARSMVPRGHEVLHHHGLEDFVDRFPCLHPECGDGTLDLGEECDPIFDPDQGCNPDCTVPVCGDGDLEGIEECDDGNTQSNDGCSATCTDEPFACGNGLIETFAGEVCDDNDSAAGDGCSSNCQSNETCGNGVVDTIRGETCDDGGTSYVATLDGAQETPPVVTAASGSATLTLNGDDTLTYDVTTTGLTGTMAHIHAGAAGVPGPILITLAGGPTSWAGTTAPLTAEQLAQLKGGTLYINVHTAANIAGEIRGQIAFAATASGDGCTANCRSNETCGNGVIDEHIGEACDDGNVLAGDGCDATCQFESCSFTSGPALGTRTFSLNPATSGLANSILGLGFQLGTINVTSGPFSLTAGATDAGGSAPVTLDSDVIIQIDIPLGGTVQCLKFLSAGSTGDLHCCGGHAVGMSFTRDSNTGGIPTTGGQNNGPAIRLGGIGMGGRGDLLMAFQVQESGGGNGFNCLTATYGPPTTQHWTTGTATARVLRPLQGGPLFEFSATGAPFECSAWTSEDGPGTLKSADTALAATPTIDAGNMRTLDD
jgi:cysteine-rich repeat protein